MEKVQRIYPKGIPKAIGPYTPVTAFNDLIFVSGQIPVNPKTGNIESQDIEKQTHQVMQNLKAALLGADSNFSLVTKCTILLTNMADFAKVNEAYQSYFEKDKYPSRICYAVAALPKNSLVEIDAIAIRSPTN